MRNRPSLKDSPRVARELDETQIGAEQSWDRCGIDGDPREEARHNELLGRWRALREQRDALLIRWLKLALRALREWLRSKGE
jgi:hypothetical protein